MLPWLFLKYCKYVLGMTVIAILVKMSIEMNLTHSDMPITSLYKPRKYY